MPSVDQLREQLRQRGYLSHGIERWFALDPWSSRAFWLELVTVVAKAATLIALFEVLPFVSILLFRNHPLSTVETLELTLLYGTAAFTLALILLMLVALALKLRPEIALDTPRALLAISIATAALLTSVPFTWWYSFDEPPATLELIAGLVLIVIFFVASSLTISAALLSFSIYELQRVPAFHQKPRGIPMTTAAVFLIALLFLPAYARQERQEHSEPIQVVTTPSERRLAVIAVDGLTWEIFAARPDLVHEFVSAIPLQPIRADSTTERWASAGTGTTTRFHGVRSIEGIRLRGGSHLLQTLSRFDPIVRGLGTALRLARREPLPPAVRRRDYIWESFAVRGLTSVSVNWWTTTDLHNGALDSVGQASVFAAASTAGQRPDSKALRVDEVASHRFEAEIDRVHPQFATVYLPALDVVLNRIPLDASSRLTASVSALEGTRKTLRETRARGFDVIVIGMPGDEQSGRGVMASTVQLTGPTGSPFDLVPTLSQLLGFPASAEMPGVSMVSGPQAPRIATYGMRSSHAAGAAVTDDYYQNLRSLGYIR